MKEQEIEEFVKSRDEALIDFVMNDSMVKINAHMDKYDPGFCERCPENVIKAALYKSVQECTDIPDEVKAEAAIKCIKLGFYPFAFYQRNAYENA